MAGVQFHQLVYPQGIDLNAEMMHGAQQFAFVFEFVTHVRIRRATSHGNIVIVDSLYNHRNIR